MSDTIQEQVRNRIDREVNFHYPQFKSYQHLSGYYNRIHAILYSVTNLSLFTVGFYLSLVITVNSNLMFILSFIALIGLLLVVHHYVTKWTASYFTAKLSRMMNHHIEYDQVIDMMYERMEQLTETKFERPNTFTISQLHKILMIYQSMENTLDHQKDKINSLY